MFHPWSCLCSNSRFNTSGPAYASTTEKEGTAMQALKHLLTRTAVMPLTEGNNMKLHHFGHAMDVPFVPLKLFTTAVAQMPAPCVKKWLATWRSANHCNRQCVVRIP